MGEPSLAFLKGGLGCVLAFFILAVVTAALGGRAHADLGGLVMLFVIGGVIGLVVLAFRGGGRRRGAAPAEAWTCASCGATNAGVSRGCVACGEPRP